MTLFLFFIEKVPRENFPPRKFPPGFRSGSQKFRGNFGVKFYRKNGRAQICTFLSGKFPEIREIFPPAFFAQCCTPDPGKSRKISGKFRRKIFPPIFPKMTVFFIFESSSQNLAIFSPFFQILTSKFEFSRNL